MVKIKVHSLGIVDCACKCPQAVIVSDLRFAPGPTGTTRYVLLSYEQRSALDRMLRETMPGTRTREYPNLSRVPAIGWPTLIRTHLWDSKGQIVDPAARPFNLGTERTQSWISAESLWVSASLAPCILADLGTWRARYTAQADRLRAPNWHAMTAIEALALASGLPIPEGAPADEAVSS